MMGLRIWTIASASAAVASRTRRSSPAVTSLEIPLAKNLHVMCDVAGDDVGERPVADGVAARDPSAIPGVGLQAPEQRHRRRTDRPELLDVIRPRPIVRGGAGDGDVLIEARQRPADTAREPERAIREHA